MPYAAVRMRKNFSCFGKDFCLDWVSIDASMTGSGALPQDGNSTELLSIKCVKHPV